MWIIILANLVINLKTGRLPFKSESMSVIVCNTVAINYFTRLRGQEIINEVHRRK